MLALGIAVVSGLCLALGWVFELVVLVYIALGVSLLGLMLVGVQTWQRRRRSTVGNTAERGRPVAEVSVEDVPPNDTEKAETADEPQPTLEPSGPAATNGSGELVDLASGGQLGRTSSVYVVSGRKRFHVGGCRLVVEQYTEELTLLEAREESFTPCTVCLTTEAGQLLTRNSNRK